RRGAGEHLRPRDPAEPHGRPHGRGRSPDPGRRRPLRRHRAGPALPSPVAARGLTPPRRRPRGRGVPALFRPSPARGDREEAKHQMAELTISPEDIRNALDTAVSTYQAGATEREEIGRVSEASDGIARVEGLPNVMANELVSFEDGTLGLALNLELREVGVVVLGEFTGIEEGQQVRRTGQVLSVPVGDGYLGRVVDPTGAPIDGLGTIDTVGRRALELQAPGVMQRKAVKEPMQTGLKAID